MAMCANNSAGSQPTSNHSLCISSSIDRKEPEETNDSSQSFYSFGGGSHAAMAVYNAEGRKR